jgi:hypothetical protein
MLLYCYFRNEKVSEFFSYNAIEYLSNCTIFANWAVVFGLRFITRYRVENDRMADWLTFIHCRPQLEVLNVPYWELSLEHLQIALENLPLLKRLDFRVVGYSFCLIGDRPYITENLPEYKLEQAEKTARLIGENYDRFENLKLEFAEESGELVTECLKKYPCVKIEKCREGIVINKI